MMTTTRPVLVALPLDHQTLDIVATATELASRLAAPLVVVHAISHQRLETEAQGKLEPHLTALKDAGVELQEVVVAVGHAANETIATASRLAAQMIVTGGGRPATVRRWMVGSVAEAIVRRSLVPVWIVRGTPPAQRPLLCPVDLSEESKIGLDAAIRMARLFELPLSLITVVNSDSSRQELAKDEDKARAQIQTLLADYDVSGLDVSLNVTASSDPAEQIVDAADEAGLLVIASVGYDPLIRDWLGPVTTRALRYSRCSTLMIRHIGEGHEERVQAITLVADIYQQAKELLADGDSEKALPMLEGLVEQTPANAAIQEAYAIALERVGRNVEATSRHELAALIRDRIR